MRSRQSLSATLGVAAAIALMVVGPSSALDTGRRLTQFSRDLWSTNDGLPDGEIGAITQTADGYLWLATQRGLARFDGVQFRLVTRETTPGLPVNYVLSLARARDGGLWLGSRGLGRYAQGRWQFFAGTAEPQHPYVFAMVEDDAGRLWVGLGGSGIWTFADGRLTPFPAYRTHGLPASVLSLALGAGGRLWAATDGGVLLVQGDQVRLFTRRDGLADDRANVVYVDRTGVAWAGTPRGLCRFDGRRFRPLAAPQGPPLKDVRALLMDRDGGLWIGTDEGLVRFARGRFERLDRATGLADDAVTALAEDREGTVWVGTDAGLNRLREGSFTPFRRSEGVVGEDVQGVHVASDGRVFFADGAGAVACLTGGVVHGVLPPGTLGSNEVSFAETRDGSVWVSGTALHRIQGARVTRYGSEGRTLTALRADGDGLLVARAERDSSCTLHRFQNGRFEPLFPGTRLPGVYDLLRDRRGDLWVSTAGGGLHRFSATGRHEVLREVGGLASDTVRQLFEDEAGTLWLAAQDGLACLRHGRWFAFDAGSGVPTEQPDRFVLDGAGALWCAWEGGVFRVRLSDLTALADGRRGPVEVHRYAVVDGLPSIRISWRQSAFSRAPDGRIWVATSRGLAVADPSSMKRGEPPPPLYVDGLVVDGRPFAATPGLALPPGSDRVELRFTAPSFAAPHRVRFEHQLVGYDPGWIDDGGRRSAHYTNLPPGSYAFRVRAHSTDGAWRAPATSLPFTLRPRWYQTRPARAIALAALAGLLVMAYRLRVSLVERRAREEGVRRLNAELERRVAERTVEVAAEKERLAVTLRSIGDGVIATDVLGRITLMSRQAEQLCDFTAEQARGRPLPEVLRLVHRDTREAIPDPSRMVLESGSACSLPESSVLLRRDGHEVLVAASAAPMRDSESRAVGVVIVLRDVSERQRLEEELRKRDKLDALGILAGGIAHDFNNLLTGILGHLDLALLSRGDGDKLARHIDSARAVSQRARGLTRQLLTFVSGEKPSRVPVRLRELVESCSRMALSGSGTSCELALAPELWTCAGDEGQIGQVIDNLLINARQAMPDGGRILVTGRNLELGDDNVLPLAPGCYVELKVQDEGQGIPRELRDKVFDPFFTTKQTGSGLGLATAYSIVKKHHGHIDFESTLGRGTTFRIYLPAAVEPAPRVVSPESEEIRGSGRILVMDDEDYVRGLAREALERLGFEVELARDGDGAVKLFTAALAAGRPFHLVILDQTVPGGMGGLATLERLLALAPWTRAIAASGYASDPVISDPAAHGFRAALVKPYTLADLSAAVARALGTLPPSPGRP